MICEKCGSEIQEEEMMEDEEMVEEEELSPEEMKEAEKLVPDINIKMVFLKDKMRELGKFKDMLDEDEDEDDYNA
jgi:hypothetical protein